MKKWKYLFLTAILFIFCACGNPSAQNTGSEDASSQESSSVLDDEQSSSLSGDSCVTIKRIIQVKSDFEKKEYPIDDFSCNLSYGYEKGQIVTKVTEHDMKTRGGIVLLLDKPREERLRDVTEYILQGLDYKEEYSQTFSVAAIIPIDEFIDDYAWERVDGDIVFQHTEKVTVPKTLLKTEGERTLHIVVCNYILVPGIVGGHTDVLIIDYEVEGDTVRIIDIRK